MSVRGKDLGRGARAAWIVGLSVLVVLCGVSVAQAASGVVWDVRSTANSTVAPGRNISFAVRPTNVGDIPTDGSTVTLRATFPAGMRLVTAAAIHPSWSCAGFVIGASSVECTSTAITNPRPIGPFQLPRVLITASVDADARAGVHTVAFDVSGGHPGAVSGSWVDPTLVAAAPLAYGIEGFDGGVFDAAGGEFTQAGGRPFEISTDIALTRGTDPRQGELWPAESLRTVTVDLPAGLIGDPTVTGGAKCTVGELANNVGPVQEAPRCPDGSQVGVALVDAQYQAGSLDIFLGPVSVYAMVAPPDAPARFGFNVSGSVVLLDARVRPGDYGVSIDVSQAPQALAIIGTRLTLWGVPADPAHDVLRSCSGQILPYQGGPSAASGCPQSSPRVPFLRNPTSCVAPVGSAVQDGLVTRIYADSWESPGARLADGSPDLSDPDWKSASFVSHLLPGFPADPDDPGTPWGAHQLPTDCGKVPFEPSIEARPTGLAKVSSPASFSFDVGMEQNANPDGIAAADLRKAVVTLPAGVRVSPSSAQGLAACSQAQIGLGTSASPSCPDGSKLGTVTIETPLLEAPLQGAVYLAAPRANPFGTLLGIYLVAEGQGLMIKLAGRVDADPASGQLTATFDDNPQTPFTNLHLEFKGGPRAPLVTPDMCGTYVTRAVFTAWSGKTVQETGSFTVSADGKGAACPATREFSPDFHGGVANPVAGASSPLLVTFGRDDLDQQLDGVSVEMPHGVLGKIRNVVLCGEANAAAGSCGEASRIGGVTVGAGAGPNPFYITNGRAYLTGPYRGGQFGLSMVVPAVAGPFDLGNVNVRAAVHVDRRSAQLRVVSDPLPRILEGIPLDVRDVRVSVDKDDFTVNPTSCRRQDVKATLRSTGGVTAERSTRFQVAGCGDLELAPRVSMAAGKRRRTQRGRSTPLTTIIRQSGGQSNLKTVAVKLPLTLNARLDVVNNACTLTEYEAGDCEAARAGTATAWTPLLADPLRGGAYFVRNGRPLPDLVIGLRGQVDLDLFGKVSIPGGKRLATRFEDIPDAAIRKFKLALVAGRQGPIGVARNLCQKRSRRARAVIAIRGHNGDLTRKRQKIHVRGCAKTKRTTAKRNR